MAEEIICRKGRGHFWDFIGGEIFFGLATTAMLLVAIRLPLEEDVAYIRYIFAGLTVIMAGFLCAVAYGHVGFARLPDCLLKKVDSATLPDNFNRRYIKLREIEEIRADCAKNKYGKPYSYGTLTLVTAQGSFKIKNADNPSAAKQRIEELKAQSERSGV